MIYRMLWITYCTLLVILFLPSVLIEYGIAIAISLSLGIINIPCWIILGKHIPLPNWVEYSDPLDGQFMFTHHLWYNPLVRKLHWHAVKKHHIKGD